MEEKLIEKSCADFAEALRSKAAVPGGGGAAALVGALGTALCSMAGNLTLGRKKYAEQEPHIRSLLERGERVRLRLLELVDEDARAFEPLSRAYSIPKDDPARAQVLERETLAACRAPAEMMERCCEAVELLEEMLQRGSAMLASDVGCGALLCAAALESAALNVFVNTRTLQSREEKAALEEQADRLLREYVPRARQVAESVARRLREV